VLVSSAVYPQVAIVKLALVLFISTGGARVPDPSSIHRPLWTTWGWSFAHNTHLVHVTCPYPTVVGVQEPSAFAKLG